MPFKIITILWIVFSFMILPSSAYSAKKVGGEVEKLNLNKELLLAVQNNDLNKTKSLLDRGADVNFKDYMGNSTLMWATMKGNSRMATLLIDHGAAVNQKNDMENTALLAACEEKRADLAELLLAKGADINVKNFAGMTPLMLASTQAALEMVKLLLAKGADVHAVDNRGRSALNYAEYFYIPELEGVLGKKGRKPLLRGGVPEPTSPEEEARRARIKEILRSQGAKPGKPSE